MAVKWILSRTGLSTHWKERLVTTWRGTKSSVILPNKQGKYTAFLSCLFLHIFYHVAFHFYPSDCSLVAERSCYFLKTFLTRESFYLLNMSHPAYASIFNENCSFTLIEIKWWRHCPRYTVTCYESVTRSPGLGMTICWVEPSPRLRILVQVNRAHCQYYWRRSA